jgi:nicotinamide-nucleotide amidase
MDSDDTLYVLAAAVGQAALSRQARITSAESCTGGLVAAAITAVAGSSDWFDRGFITYSNAAKVDMLAVPTATLARFGAVSVETARAMADGALRPGGAQWSVAVTGIAGPGGGTPAKPVGTVCFAWAGPGGTDASCCLLEGDRAAVRNASVHIALKGLLERLL